MNKWKVALFNRHAQCGIVGPVARSRDKAFELAIERAEPEFLNCGGEGRALAFYREVWPDVKDRSRQRTAHSIGDAAFTLELRRVA